MFIRKSSFTKLAETAVEELKESQRRLLADNPDTSGEILDRLAKDESIIVLLRVIRNRNILPETLNRLSEHGEMAVRSAVAAHAKTPFDAFIRLAKEASPSIHKEIARNQNAPPEALRLLAKTSSSSILEDLAKNKRTPPDTLTLLAKSEFPAVWERVAANDKAPPEALSMLASSTVEDVRLAVAANRATPKSALIELASEGSDEVCYIVASNPSAPPEAFSLLIASGDDYTKRLVAENESLHPEALLLLARDKDSIIRKLVADNPSLPDEGFSILVNAGDPEIRATLAQNKSAPASVLLQLSQDFSAYVREGVAQNTYTPADILIELTKDGSRAVRSYAAHNPSCPLDLAAQFQDEEAKRTIEEQEASITEHKDLLLTRNVTHNAQKQLYRVLYKHMDSGKKYGREDIVAFAKKLSDDDAVRKAITRALSSFIKDSPKTPPENRKEFLTKQDLQSYIEDKAPHADKEVTYREDKWNIQNAFGKKQLTFQINFKNEYVRELRKDPEKWRAYALLSRGSLASTHPVLPIQGKTIGWARVTVLATGDWYIEEVQSDIIATARQTLHALLMDMTKESFGHDDGLDPKDFSEKTLKAILKELNNFPIWAVDTVLEHAHLNGVEHVYMPDALQKESQTKMNSTKATEIYEDLPKTFHFKKVKEDIGLGAKDYWKRVANIQRKHAEFFKTCIIQKTKEGYTVWNKKKTRRFGTYKNKEDAEKRLEQIHYFGRISKK